MLRILLPLIAFGFCAQAQAPNPFASFDKASEPVLNDPHDLAMGPDGHLYIADKFGNQIVVMDAETLEVIRTIGEGAMYGVHDIAFDRDGRSIVAVTGLSAALVFNDLETSKPEPVAAYRAMNTEGALIHSTGRIFVMASGQGVVGAFDGDEWVNGKGGHLGAHDIAEAPNGDIWVADNANRRLVRYSVDLAQLQILDHLKFGFVGPRYMDIDEWGRLIVADQDAHRILLIDPEGPDGGTLIGVLGDGAPGIGPGKFDDPEGALVDGGRYYFADSDNNRIVRYVVVVN
ncbi:MAG: NHL repeat-containing protein [Paracoccaceae bacterium]|nr:NHL repeat-containing protein [Paracoccaceae bacterium]MDG1209218.1 NHL repeat-containing protein [Paracoccaceae bacterium]MDG1371873.1 NHL repeat-containing protein [Paracoccaceae bacterium]